MTAPNDGQQVLDAIMYQFCRERFIAAASQETADYYLPAMLSNVTLEGKLPGWDKPGPAAPAAADRPETSFFVKFVVQTAVIAVIAGIAWFSHLLPGPWPAILIALTGCCIISGGLWLEAQDEAGRAK